MMVEAVVANPVGLIDIAERLSVSYNTMKAWYRRGKLPTPRWTVSGNEAWDWDIDIIPWWAERNQ